MSCGMFLRDLSILSRYSRTFIERQLSEFNIGFTEHMIMLYLCDHDPVNQENIAKHFLLDKGAVAKALNKLEDKEFILRSDNPNNKREKLISITNFGQSKIGYLYQEFKVWHDYLYEGLSKDEIDQCIATISQISMNASKVIHQYENSDNKKERQT